MSGRVVNVRTAERDEWDVYIGRAQARAADPRCRVGSPFANGFPPGREGVRTVEESLELYGHWLRERVKFGGPPLGSVPDEDVNYTGAWWQVQLRALDGKRLGCWCAPDPCHGDIVLVVIDEVMRRVP